MDINSVIEICDARLPDDMDSIKHLWTDYLTWGNDNMQMNYGVHPHNPMKQVEQDSKMISKFLPPNGRLILAFIDEKPCGIGCLQSINNEIGEIKRMYVDPSFRKIGAGKTIVQSIIKCCKRCGVQKSKIG